MSDAAAAPLPSPEPLFSLDLGGSGGILAPIDFNSLRQWIDAEQSFWNWQQQVRGPNNHLQGVRAAISQLNQARQNVDEAERHLSSNPQHSQGQLSQCRNYIEEVYKRRLLPHSSTPAAKRIEAYQQEQGNDAGGFFAAVFVPPDQGHHYQPQDLPMWRGLVEGVIERFELGPSVARGRRQAADRSFEQLRLKAEELVGTKTEAYDALHRQYAEIAALVQATATAQEEQFAQAQGSRDEAFETLRMTHETGMESLRKTFREEMALKAPAEYWELKRKEHDGKTKLFAGLSFGGMAVAALVLGWQIHDLLSETPKGSSPDTWRVAVLVLLGLFAVWAVRLVVRMFLSNLHLATDAAERFVMLKTYLSLLVGDRLASKEDRQLILQALFRPASDGIVKDEGIPPSFLEVLTRGPKQ